MANSIFLDTNGWLALLNATDDLHAKAGAVWLDLGSQATRIVLTDWIIAETGNGLARSQIKSPFAEAVERIIASPHVDLVFVDEPLLRQAIGLYATRVDKSWGLVDCASFAVMRERAMSDAFTSDQHFEQAGFNRLLPI
jgi:predicted nucleic acid-binding protein